MANKCEWLYVEGDWDQLIEVCQKEKNHAKRLQFFNEYLNIDGDHLTIKDVCESWMVIWEEEISEVAEELFYNDYSVFNYSGIAVSYWFFNIYTGEMRHVDYAMKLTCSGVVGD